MAIRNKSKTIVLFNLQTNHTFIIILLIDIKINRFTIKINNNCIGFFDKIYAVITIELYIIILL